MTQTHAENPSVNSEKKITIAIIGGTGLTELNDQDATGPEITKIHDQDSIYTELGAPSSPIARDGGGAVELAQQPMLQRTA